MKNLLAFITCFFLLTGSLLSQPSVETATPESLGISSAAILNFIEAAETERKDELHSFVLYRHGKLAAEGWWNPYDPESPHMLFSLSKSFTSTAIGIAQSEGLLTVNDKVISFFPEFTPDSPSRNLQAMRIRDLLSMNSGHNDDATDRLRTDTSSWVRAFLSLNVEHKPGTHFVYNSAATFMLSAIIQKVTGKTLLEYLTPRLFQPLGITNPTWENAPGGINVGGWGLKIRTRDIAQLGQLYLQKGNWQGKQLVPAAWVEEATKKQSSNGSNPDSDWEQGYGYQFWRCRYDLYRGDGAFGQYCIVFPKQDAVLAITSGTKDMGAIMNLVWKHLLPAMSDAPVAENPAAYAGLQKKIGALKLSQAISAGTKPRFKMASKQSYVLDSNTAGFSKISFDWKAKQPSVEFVENGMTYSIPISTGGLTKGTFTLPMGEKTPLASSGGWFAPDTLEVHTYLYETPFHFTYRFSFSGNEIRLIRTSNLNIGPASRVELKGRKS
jgi:CubicO group peptidase (beta-lactamase class C family)